MDDLLSLKPLVYHNDPNFIMEPKNKFVNCNQLNPITLKNLNGKQMTYLCDIQMYGIPAMIADRNVILISHGYSGKTTSYVIFLCSWLIENTARMDRLVMAPSIVILCPFSKICENVKNLFERIGWNKGVIVASQMNEAMEKKLFIEMLDCCNILICTPNCLLRLINVKNSVNWTRVRYFVTESADILRDRFSAETENVASFIEEKSPSLKKIHVADRWCSYFKNTALKQLNTSLIITAFEEAVVACNLRCVPCLSVLNNRMKSLLDAIQENLKKKPVVVCCTVDEVKLAESIISSQILNCRLYALSTISMSNNLEEIYGLWLKENYEEHMILICTDEVLKELPVTNSRCLIHLSLPKRKRDFSFRFTVLKDVCKNIIKNGDEADSAKIYLVESEENFIQSAYMWSMKEKLKMQVSDELCQKYETYIRTNLTSLKALCPQMKKFGYCNEYCSYRHDIIKKLDEQSEKMQKCGVTKVGITHIMNPSHICCRLVNSQTDRTNSLLRKMKMKQYLGVPKNRVRTKKVKVNDVMGIAGEEKEVYHRVRVLKILKHKYFNEEVIVRYVDIGKIANTKIDYLYSLPNEIKNMPEEAIDVYIIGLWPLDKGISWEKKITDGLIEKMNSLSIRHETFSGNIKFALGRELWVDDLRVEKHLQHSNISIIDYSVKHYMLKDKLALKNENHFSNLQKLCQLAEISTPVYSNGLVKEEKVEKKVEVHDKSEDVKEEEMIEDVEKEDENEMMELYYEAQIDEVVSELFHSHVNKQDNNITLKEFVADKNLKYNWTEVPEITCNGTSNGVPESSIKPHNDYLMLTKGLENKLLSNGEKDEKNGDASLNCAPKIQRENIFPAITWKQNLEYVYIYASIVDIKKHYLRCEPRRIIFRALNYDQSYFFDIELFGGVIPGETKISQNGFQFTIKLRKLLMGAEWSRLIRSEIRIPYIKRALVGDVTEPTTIKDSRNVVMKMEDNNEYQSDDDNDSQWVDL